MIKPTVVNIRDSDFDVYIGRHNDPIIGKWGNPFTTKESHLAKFKVDSKKEALSKYKEYVLNNKYLMDSLDELYGKRLGCFCKPGDCHGDILVELVNDKLNGFIL